MATSSPLHSGGSASRQPSSHSLHGITASNAALPSHKHEGLVGPLRPWSGSRSCGGPPRPRYHLRSNALEPQRATQIVARGRAVRVRLCPWILQAPTMSAAIGTKNNIGTRVERREKPSDLWIPYYKVHSRFDCVSWPRTTSHTQAEDRVQHSARKTF